MKNVRWLLMRIILSSPHYLVDAYYVLKKYFTVWKEKHKLLFLTLKHLHLPHLQWCLNKTFLSRRTKSGFDQTV